MSKGLPLPLPDDSCIFVGGESRGGEVVGVQIADLLCVADVVYLGNELSSLPEIVSDQGAVGACFSDQLAGLIIMVHDRAAGCHFSGPLPIGVVGVGGEELAVFVELIESAGVVVVEVTRGFGGECLVAELGDFLTG